MTEILSLQVQPRDASVRRSGKKLHRNGMIAGVVYGPKIEPISVQLEPKALHAILTTEYGRNAIFNLEVEGATHLCMVKDTQFDPVRREITHVDFYVVDLEQTVLLSVPVAAVGRSAGEKLGGLLQTPARELKVRCKVKDIPVNVPHDVTKMNLSDQVSVDQLAAPEGCEIVYKHRFPVIRIATRRGAVAAAAAEAAEASA